MSAIATGSMLAPSPADTRRGATSCGERGGAVAAVITEGRGACGARRRVAGAARAQAGRTRATMDGGAEGAGGSSDDSEGDLVVQWMCLNYRPWIKSDEDAAKCLAHLREKEGREFNLEKAKHVLDSIKADHQKYTPQVPFELPKVWPGFLLILERSSDKTAR